MIERAPILSKEYSHLTHVTGSHSSNTFMRQIQSEISMTGSDLEIKENESCGFEIRFDSGSTDSEGASRILMAVSWFGIISLAFLPAIGHFANGRSSGTLRFYTPLPRSQSDMFMTPHIGRRLLQTTSNVQAVGGITKWGSAGLQIPISTSISSDLLSRLSFLEVSPFFARRLFLIRLNFRYMHYLRIIFPIDEGPCIASVAPDTLSHILHG
ncbi:unnamed protein product [Protopolystoma xenopodis]|uniref:Uncharacterized protein n=1 Tax=Protopolystoma xenopodis TaxID=117903 RepID=A0A3S5CLY9_9PLAT|nr:unnamed protein product [Protopolystoma xenopodis]